ncbi:MAG: hypothetical protein KatS3mg055_2630 [Chloroflexus sp.]|nr:MAG: hypothetical protein KatS3mg055_2630 [Chloroflexus sp.]
MPRRTSVRCGCMLWAYPITGVESVGLWMTTTTLGRRGGVGRQVRRIIGIVDDDDDVGATHRVAPTPIRPVRWYVVGMPHHGRGIGWIVG